MIHVTRGAAGLGVFSEEDVREGLRTGRFLSSDLGWREGMASWEPLSQFEELGPGVAVPSPRSPPPLPPSPPPVHETSSAARPGTSLVEGGGRVIRIARNYLLPRGRIGRAQFIVRTALIWVVWGVLLTLVLSPLSFGFRSGKPDTAAAILGVVFVFFGLAALVFFWVASMQAAKRLHDFNHSGAWYSSAWSWLLGPVVSRVPLQAATQTTPVWCLADSACSVCWSLR
jgi:uncharacterized membrane protein YhaH (DUF805 family)